MYDTLTCKTSHLRHLPFKGHCCGAILKEYFYSLCYESGQMFRIHLCKPSKWDIIVTTPRIQDFPNAVISNQDYLFIFHHNGGEIHRYDPITNEFIHMSSSIKANRCPPSIAVANNKIYVIGGIEMVDKKKGDYIYTSSVEIFDTDTQLWSLGPPLPRQLWYDSATVVLNRWIVLMGGLNGVDYNKNTFIFDTKIDNSKWISSEIGLSTPTRTDHACVTIGSQIISVGGQDENGIHSCPMQAIEIKYLISEWRWEQLKDLILLRKLVDIGRACPTILSKKQKVDTDLDTIMWKLIHRLFSDTSLDMFRNVLSFLI